MRDFNQMIQEFKSYLKTNNSVREFLLLELSEQEFLFFKLMFESAHIAQNYHELQTEFFFWWSGCEFIEDEQQADVAYDHCCEMFYGHLKVINDLYIGGCKLEGSGSNIDAYELINISPTSLELQETVQN